MLARKGQLELDTTQVAIVASKPAASWSQYDRSIAHDALHYLLLWWAQRKRSTQRFRKTTKRQKES